MSNQKGFAAVFIIIPVLILLTIIGFFFFKPQQNPQIQVQTIPAVSPPANPSAGPIASVQSTDEPPLKLKGIGINFSDFKFTKQKLQFNRLFMGFGFVIPGNMSSTQEDKSNPQPTFIVPLGTPVRSIVDGVVANMPTLWSGDISIQVTENGKMEKWIYETEHVKSPKVKVGDKIKAGQIIAEVGSFGGGDPPGYGAVEIGILKGGVQAQHVCPFAYLDDSIKDETLAKIKKLFKDWEDYTGDQTLYNESLPIPGCLTLDPIQG